MNQFFIKLLNMSFAAGVLVPVVILLRLVLKRAPKWTRCLLWAFVALRLLLPIEIASPLSLFNALGRQENGSVEYFYAAGGSEKPLVSFDTFRFDGSAGPEDRVINFPDGAPLVRHEATRYLPPLVTVWAIGVGLMLLYLLWSYARLRRRVRASAPLEDRVWICDGIDAPFILGLFRPCIYVPSTLAEPQLSHVLAHEWAHLARRDHWWKPLGFALLAVHWFNPLLWLAYFLLCRDIELACDEKVFKGMDPAARTDYSQALLDLSRPRAIAACPLAFGETGVKARIKAALSYKKPAFWLILAAVVLCAVAAVSFLTNPVKSFGTELSAKEWGWLREYLLEYDAPGKFYTHVDVLYDRDGSARYLFGCYEGWNEYVILDRTDGSLVERERGDHNPYENYMTVPKFYENRPRAFMIRGNDAGPSALRAKDDELYDLRARMPAGEFGARARRLPDAKGRYSSLPLGVFSCGDQSVEAFEALRWSAGRSEDPDGAPLADQIRQHKNAFTPLVRTGRIILSMPPNAYLIESGVQVFNTDLEPIAQMEDGYGFIYVQNLMPGEYYCAVEVRADRGDGPVCYDCVFLLEVPEEEAADIPAGPLLTVTSGDHSVQAYPCILWSERDGLSADGLPLETQIQEAMADIPVLVYDKPITVSCRADTTLNEGSLLVFDDTMQPVIRSGDGIGIEGIQTLGPGTYICALDVEVKREDSASGGYCVFCLEIPEVQASVEGVPDDILATLRAIPREIDPEAMSSYSVVVTDPEMRIYNMALWNSFYSCVQMEMPADIAIALYVNDRDTGLYYIRYDGSRFLLVQDNTRLPATNVGSPDYDTDVYANLQVLPREGHQIALLSDRLYASYEEYRESLSVELEHWPQAVMMWKETAQ